MCPGCVGCILAIAVFVSLQGDRRTKRKKWRLSGGGSSTESSPSHKAMEVIASPCEEDETDLDILGFYPSFDQNNALVSMQAHE